MILMYHKVHPESPTIWWVTVDNFYRQMAELGDRKVVYLDQYDPSNPDHTVVTFDGVYQNVYSFAAPILQHFKYPFELFVTGDFVGQQNEFDTGEPSAPLASNNDLSAMVSMGGRLQWHTRSHPRLSEISNKKEIKKELTVPSKYKRLDAKGFNWLAYPHSVFNATTIEVAETIFSGAVSVIHGDESSKFQYNRITVQNSHSFKKSSVGVIIPCYNYARFLVEAVESVLRQTRPADQIVISDDASTDNTKEVAEILLKKYPGKISYFRNKSNLGIIRHFNKVADTLSTDYICFIGADNRIRSDYLEKTTHALDTNPDVAIAYTDFALFGPRAAEEYTSFPKSRRKGIIDDHFHLITFPDFNKTSAKEIATANFIHGSSLFRNNVFKAVGRYRKDKNIAEDHGLFSRMISAGWKAKRIPEALLEYRQHSSDQANLKVQSQSELHFYRSHYKSLEEELTRIKTSKFWRLLYWYKNPKSALKEEILKLLH